MAGSVVITYKGSWNAPIKRVSMAWTAAGGVVSGTTTKTLAGEIMRVVTVPGTGSVEPDDDYDVTIEDEFGLDLLMGEGADRDESTTEHIAPGIISTDGTTKTARPVPFTGTLELKVANAGGTNTGVVHVYYR